MYGHLHRVRVVWVVKTEAEAKLFADTFSAIAKDSLKGVFSVGIFITGSREGHSFAGHGGTKVIAMTGTDTTTTPPETPTTPGDSIASGDFGNASPHSIYVHGDLSKSEFNRSEETLSQGSAHSSSEASATSSAFMRAGKGGDLHGQDYRHAYITSGTRPNLPAEIGFLSRLRIGPQALVFACGPAPLVRECATLSGEAGVHFKHEYFEW
jgi:hypothetical protein